MGLGLHRKEKSEKDVDRTFLATSTPKAAAEATTPLQELEQSSLDRIGEEEGQA